jgi:protein SCO1/2
MNESPANPQTPLSPWSIWMPIIIAVLGIVVFYNWLIYRSAHRQRREGRPPIRSWPSRKRPRTHRAQRQKSASRRTQGQGARHLLGLHPLSARLCGGDREIEEAARRIRQRASGLHFLSFTLDADDTPEMMKSSPAASASRTTRTGGSSTVKKRPCASS